MTNLPDRVIHVKIEKKKGNQMQKLNVNLRLKILVHLLLAIFFLKLIFTNFWRLVLALYVNPTQVICLISPNPNPTGSS